MNEIINLVGPMNVNSNLINKDLFSIIIDGGLNHNLKLKKFYSIGDQDSTTKKVDELLSKDKDYSDLYFSLKHIPPECSIVNCYGLVGGRLDHQLCVLGDLLEFSKIKSCIFNLYDQANLSIKIIPPGKYQIEHTGTFSVLSINDQKIFLSGDIKYKNKSEYTHIKPLSSHTLSNIADGKILIRNEFSLCLIFYYQREL